MPFGFLFQKKKTNDNMQKTAKQLKTLVLISYEGPKTFLMWWTRLETSNQESVKEQSCENYG